MTTTRVRVPNCRKFKLKFSEFIIKHDIGAIASDNIASKSTQLQEILSFSSVGLL